MDERVRRTVATYDRNAERYAELHGDRDVIAHLVDDFLEAVEADGDREGGGERVRDGDGSERPRVLDVGPGPGWESATFADHGLDVVAVDVTRSFLELTRDRAPAVDGVAGDMRSLPFADDGFDGLWVCASLLHVPRENVPGTLAEFERVLAPGGRTIVSLQRRQAEPGSGESDSGDGDRDGDERDCDDSDGSDGESVVRSPYDDDRRHFERYEPSEIREAFETVGFAVESVDPDGDWVAITARAE